MSLVNISNFPLNVVFKLFYAPLNETATQNSQYSQTTESLFNALPLLPQNLQNQLSPITPFLAIPLGVLFNNTWFGMLPNVQNLAAQQFNASAAGGGVSVSNVSCSLSPFGVLLGEVIPAQGGQAATLLLDFSLKGGDFHFNSGPLGAAWKIDFDADLTISTPVPVQPFGLSPVAIAALSNASMHADNFGASLDSFLDNLFTDLGNFFSGGNFISDVNWAEQQAAQDTDQSAILPAADAQQLVQLFNLLNSAGPQCVDLGFVQCAFSIAGNGQLSLTVTHPLDQGPAVDNADHPQGVLILPPELAATASEAVPGTSVNAIGTYFPSDTTTSLNLQWPNTTSGKPVKSELSVNGQKLVVNAPAGAGTNLLYTFTPTGLSPNTNYKFEARCGDELTWSKWGPIFELATAPTNIADLVLSPVGGGQTWTIGSAHLPAPHGTWACNGSIPASVPTGQYYLQATLGGSLIAQTEIAIVASLSPAIEIIDPTTKAVVEAPIFGATPFTLRGIGFPDGPVTINFNGAAVANTSASGGGFIVNLVSPGTAYTEETVNVTAVEGPVVATLNPPIYLEGQPQ